VGTLGEHPPFEQGSALLGCDRPQLPLGSPDNSGIDPTELGMAPFAHAQPRFEGGEQGDEQRVLQDPQIPFNSGARRGRVARDIGDVNHLAVKQRRDRKETQKPWQVRTSASPRISSRT
jgi:hypothetical protein